MKNCRFLTGTFALVVIALLATGGAEAQLQTGNLRGAVVDQENAALPGVTVTLTGGGPSQVQVTNAKGRFRFLGLAPGTYLLRFELEGFSTAEYPIVSISVGRNSTIKVSLNRAVEDSSADESTVR